MAQRAGGAAGERAYGVDLSTHDRLDKPDAAPAAGQRGDYGGAERRYKTLESELAVLAQQHPAARVAGWAMDEHRIGFTPVWRRRGAPRGKRPVVAIHPRSQWRSRSGFVHPASGQTQWHLSSSVSIELFARSLKHFAQQAGAGVDKAGLVVLDRAGWHVSSRLTVPDHPHGLPLPPYSPEPQPAWRRWPFSNTPLVNARPAALDALDMLQLGCCLALQTDPIVVAAIQSTTRFHWWPADYSPLT